MSSLVVELLLLLIIIWIYTESLNSQYNTTIPVDQSTKIEEIKAILGEILADLQIEVSYQLQVGTTSPYVADKKIIYLPVADSRTGRIYDDATLLQVALHELAHVICPSVHHTSLFYSIESELLMVAQEKGYLKATDEVADDYPCFD